MKKSYANEAVATILGLLGALVLVTGLMPFINPGFVDANATEDYSPRMAFLVPVLISLPLLGMAWHFNKKAREIRRELREPKKVASPLKRAMKRIIFGVVVVLLLMMSLC